MTTENRQPVREPHVFRKARRLFSSLEGYGSAWRANPAAEPSCNRAEHEGDEAKYTGPRRVTASHVDGPRGLEFCLLYGLPILLLGLVHTVAGLFGADIGNASETVHGVISGCGGRLLVTAYAGSDVANEAVLDTLGVRGIHETAYLGFQTSRISNLGSAGNNRCG